MAEAPSRAATSTLGFAFQRIFRIYRVEVAMLLVLVLLGLGMQMRSSVALSSTNIRNVLDEAAPLFLMSIGQLFVVITGGIDLSVAATYALSSMAAAQLMQSHSAALSVTLGVLVGLGVGLVNGVLVVYARLVPFIVTLATLSIAGSLAYVVSNGEPLTVDNFGGFNGGYLVPSVPNYVTVIVLTAIAAHLFLRRTVMGRFLYATGSSEEAARLAGIPSGRIKLFAYTAAGGLSAVAGLLAMSELAAVDPSAGSSVLLLNSIAAVVIGGASLFGGLGSAPGALIGVLIISLLQNALVILQVPSFWQGTMSGIVIVIAVLIERVVRKGGWLPRLERRLHTGRQELRTGRKESG